MPVPMPYFLTVESAEEVSVFSGQTVVPERYTQYLKEIENINWEALIQEYLYHCHKTQRYNTSAAYFSTGNASDACIPYMLSIETEPIGIIPMSSAVYSYVGIFSIFTQSYGMVCVPHAYHFACD